ncbi:MAG: insulinase family protein [Candidatus Omnitrophica bacterium]|nr:insulinase family protein [Candidatus Omnitrophota bacterium]
MKKFLPILILLLLLSNSKSVFASKKKCSELPSSSSEDFVEKIKTTRTVFDNGLTVLVSEIPTSPFASVYILVKTGSVTEGKYLGSGITHFVEHMLFKGTDKRGVGEIPAQVNSVGGSINAQTGKDHTIYTITLPYEEFDVALDVLSDMIVNPRMDAEEMEKERKVIIAEMRMHRDNPDRELARMAFENIYKFHPYKYEIIGEESLFRKISNEDLKDYYKTHYSPNNMILSIAGNVRTDEVIKKAQKAFEGFERQRYVVRNVDQEPEQIGERRMEKTYPVAISRMSIGFSGVRLLDKDLFPLDVLSIILGYGRSSRLYSRIYEEKNLVYSINSSNYTPVDKGAFEIECVLEEKNIDETIEEVVGVIEALKKKGINKNELEKARRWVLKDYIFGRQQSSQLAGTNAYDEAFAGDYRFSKRYVEGIEKVAVEDVLRVAEQYLNRENMSVSILRPQGEKAADVADPEEVRVPAINKYVLDNGITVLLSEDHSFNVATIRAAFYGGLRQEPEDLRGISSMMTSLWTKGTKSFESSEIAELSESLGIEYNSFSGRNSFGVSLRFLPVDFQKAFELFKDTIKDPVFPKGEMPQVKERMKASIRSKKDNIYSYADQALREELFKDNTFKYDSLGTVETLDAIGRDDILGFYEGFLKGSNLVIAVFGNIDEQQVLNDIKKDFGFMKKGSVDLKYTYEKEMSVAKVKELELDKKEAIVLFGFQGPFLDGEDRYGVEVLTEILGSSFNGRLFNVVREKFGKAYTLGGDYLPSKDAGYISLFVKTSPENVEKVKDLVLGEINDLRANIMADKDVSDIKMHLKGVYKRNLETSYNLSFVCLLDQLYGFGFDYYKKYDESINSITPAMIKDLAVKYLDPDKMAIVIVRPEKEQSEE